MVESARCAQTQADAGIHFESLEPRLLLSGSWDAVFVDSMLLDSQHIAQSAEEAEHFTVRDEHNCSASINGSETIDILAGAKGVNNFSSDDTTSDNILEAESLTDLAGQDLIEEVLRRELVFVDTAVANYQQLVNDLLTQKELGRQLDVVLLDNSQDGIEQISEALVNYQDLDAVHVVSHGTDGALQLGNTRLKLETIDAYSHSIEGWRDALTGESDLLFYGCDLAGNGDGQALLASMSALTGADVAASTDVTGHAIFGGDWDLEYSKGKIETGVAFSTDVQQNWGHALAVSIDSTSVGTTPSYTLTDSVSHTTGGSNRLMLVGISFGEDKGDTVSSVKYNGDPLFKVGVKDHTDSATSRVEIWARIAPDIGTFDVDVTYSGNAHEGATIGVMTFANVDQSTPLGSFSSSVGNSTTLSTTVASAPNDLVFGVAAHNSSNNQNFTFGDGQTSEWDLFRDKANGAGSTEAGASSVVTSYGVDDSGKWVVGGVSVRHSTSPGVVTWVPGAQNTDENSSLVFSTGNGNTITVDDGTTGDPVLHTTLSVTNGILNLITTDGLSFDSGADGTSWMAITGLESAINTALDGLSFTPTGDYNGPANLQITVDLQANLLARYTFDNPNPPDLGNDDSPAGTNDGTVVNATAAVDGTRGNVLSLDAFGGADYVQIAGQFGNPTNVTLAAWVNPTTAPIFGSEVITLGANVGLRVDDLGNLKGFIYDGSDWQIVTYGTTLAGSGWHHVAYIFDDAGNTQKLYLDGIEVESIAETGSISYTQASNSFIGTHGDGSTAHDYTGKIDDVRIYDRVLTDSEIANLFAETTTNTGNVLITVQPVNDNPTGSGSLTTTSLNDNTGATNLFSDLTVNDVDTGESDLTLRITLSDDTAGTITGGGFTDQGGGVYTATGLTVAQANTALDNVQFTPTNNSGPTGNFTTDISVEVDDQGGAGYQSVLAPTTVTINRVNDAPALGNNNLTITEGATVTLDNSMLSAADADHPDPSLTFNVTGVTAGHFAFSSDTATPIISFDQSDITAGTVVFVHDGGEAPPSYSVSVTDGTDSTAAIPANITFTNQNDPPMVVTNAPLNVPEEATRIITSAYLETTDPDNSPDQIIYTLTNLPSGGSIRLSGTSLSLGQTFTQDDINNNRVTYRDSDDGATTNFQMTVGDGNTTSPAFSFSVNGQPINDAPFVSAPGSALNATEQIGLPIHGTGFSVSDSDEAGAGALATLTVGEGTITVVEGNSGVNVDSGNGTSAVTLSGTIAQLNALLTGTSSGTITYLNTSDSPSSSTTLTVTVNDQGNTGSDPGLTGDGSSEEGNNNVTINIASVNDAPSIGGTIADQPVNDFSTVLPFSTVTISDVDFGDMVATKVTLSDGDDNGTFTATSLAASGFTKTAVGEYSLASRTPPAAQTAIRLLVFDPTENQVPPPGTVTTTFTIEVDDGDVAPTDNTTTVIATSLDEFMVTNTNDAGPGSLRQAIFDANLSSGTDAISFDIPLTDPNHYYYKNDFNGGTLSQIDTTTIDDASNSNFDPDYPYAQHSWFTIDLDPAQPLIITDPVIIDGYTQSGAAVNTRAVGDDAIIKIELTCSAADTNRGLTVEAGGAGSIIRGLAINDFRWSGIMLESGADGVTVQGTYLGADVTGSIDIGNGDDGVHVRSNNNLIGGPSPEHRNIMSGNAGNGVAIYTFSGTADNNIIENNYIGADATGTQSLRNDSHGLSAYNLRDSFIRYNLISNNNGSGIWLRTSTTAGNTIEGNLIGTNAAGTSPMGNVSHGIYISDGAYGNIIGGTISGKGNTIAYNGADGISLETNAGDSNTIRGNSIHSNAQIGIDLNSNGPTGNDPNDSDGGPNNVLNYPDITSAYTNAVNSITIDGEIVDGLADTDFEIDFFYTVGESREGGIYLGTTAVSTNPSGYVAFNNVVFNGFAVPDLAYMTATATAVSGPETGNTSEFSANFQASVNNQPTISGCTPDRPVNDNAAVTPFDNVTIGDVDNPAQTLAVAVAMDSVDKGTFTTLNGFTDSGGGVFSFSGTAAAATAAIRGMVFDPADNRKAPGDTETTFFAISAYDGIAPPATDNTTTVISTSVNDAPVIGGTATGQPVNDNATVSPFSTVTISDVDFGEMVTVKVTLSDGDDNGAFTADSLTASGFTKTDVGEYSLASNTTVDSQAAIRLLVFDPTENQVAPGNTATTTFTIEVDDEDVAPTDSTTTVIAASINDAPVIGGTAAGQPVNDNATVLPFSSVTISDVDFGEMVTVKITLSVGDDNGIFTADSLTASGFTKTDVGEYSLASNTTADAQAAIRLLVLDPTENQVAPGNTVNTTFTIEVDDGDTAPTDSTTTVIAASINDAPSIGGTATGQAVNDNATVTPFSTVTITDADFGEMVTVMVTLSDGDNNGIFTADSLIASGFTKTAVGEYSLASSTPAAAQAAIRLLVFEPKENQVAPGSTITTSFTIEVDDGDVAPTDSSTTVIATSINDAPSIGGTATGQPVDDNATVLPFSTVTISDVDFGEMVTTKVTLSDGDDNGSFTATSLTASGFTKTGVGEYSLASSTPAAAQAAIRLLVFEPTENQVAPGSTVTTTFTIEVNDGDVAPTDNTTTVIATSINDTPAIGGTATGQPVNDNATVSPFSTVTITDADFGEMVTVMVTLSDGDDNGTFTAASLTASGFTKTDVGEYSLASSTTTAAQAAIRLLLFDPTENQVAPGSTVTTTFTIEVDDGYVVPTDNTTTVIATSINDAPSIGGTAAGQSVNDNATVSPFSTVTISDVDAAEMVTFKVILSDGDDNGTFTAASLTASGFTKTGVGEYNLSSTSPAAAQAAIRLLVFDPTENQVVPGNTVTTTFTIEVNDGDVTPTDSTTSVVATSINDAPIIGGDTSGAAIEESVLTDTGLLTITDPDDGEEVFVVQSGIGSTNGYGTIDLDAAGNWTYTLNNAHPTVQALSGGETLADSFTAVSADGTTQIVSITITGTNDAPSVGGSTSGAITEDSSLTDTGTLTITDTDNGEDVFVVQSGVGSTNGYGTVDLDAAGNWTYTLDNANATVQALSDGETLADSFTAVSADGTTQIVSITITGTNDAPSIGGDTSGAVTEDGTLTDTGSLTITDTDGGEDVFAVQSGAASTNGYGTVNLDAAGNWTYTLNNANVTVQALSGGETSADSFTAVSDDGTTQLVNITITGTNDAPIIGGDTSGAVTEDSSLTDTGTLTITDTDDGEDVFDIQSGAASTSGYGTVVLDASGNWTYTLDDANPTVQALSDGETLADSFTAVSADGATQFVSITITGINDSPVIDGVNTGSVTEDVDPDIDGLLETSSSLTITDPDSGEDQFNAETIVGSYGSLVIDATGRWTYQADNTQAAIQRLGASDSLIDTLTVTTADDTTYDIVITINGANDAPIITPGQSFSVAEDAPNNTTVGTVAANDADLSDFLQNWTITSGNSDGIFAINSNTGEITIADNTNLDFKTTAGYMLTLTVADGTNTSAPQTVTIDITDVNDNAPIITPGQNFSVAEDAPNNTVVGKVAATDADAVESLQNWMITDGNNDGIFAINSSTGDITIADNVNLDFEATANYLLTLTVADGTNTSAPQVVRINITDAGESVGAISDADNSSNAVAENATIGTQVGITAQATDADTADTITYSLDDDAGGRFMIDTNTGVATVNGAIDRESADSYDITVRATSSDTSFSTRTFTIDVTPVNDNTPVITSPDATDVAESTTAVHQVTVSDADLPGDNFTYNLVGGADQGRFTIDGSGNLSFLAAPDFETPNDADSDNDYVVDVEVSDGVNTVTQTITVTVTNVDESGIGFDSGNDDGNNVGEELESNDPETEDIKEQERDTSEDDSEQIGDEEDLTVVNEDSFTENKSQGPVITNVSKISPNTLGPALKLTNEVNIDSDEVDESEDTSQPIPKKPAPSPPVQEQRFTQGSFEASASVTRAAYERLRNSLDDLEKETANEIEFSKTVVGSAVAASVGLSVGYVVWLIRGGMLLASVLSSMPAWQIADPLPILAGDKDDSDSDDEESLEKIIKNGPKNADNKKKGPDASSGVDMKER